MNKSILLGVAIGQRAATLASAVVRQQLAVAAHSRSLGQLGFEENKVSGLVLEGAIECDHCQTGTLRESGKIGVSPVLW